MAFAPPSPRKRKPSDSFSVPSSEVSPAPTRKSPFEAQNVEAETNQLHEFAEERGPVYHGFMESFGEEGVPTIAEDIGDGGQESLEHPITHNASQSTLSHPSRRQSASTLPNREYVLGLADADYQATETGASKRVQNHPATFQCNLCSRRFSRAYNLRSHLRTHTNERPFICTVCGKSFARQHDLKRHEGLHSGEKKFVCKGELDRGGQWGCGRRFARVDALGRHFQSEAGRVCLRPLVDEDALLEPLRVRVEQQQATGHYVQPVPQSMDMQRDDKSLSVTSGNYILPAALLAQYPALATLSWSDLHPGGNGEVDKTPSGTESSFYPTGSEHYLDDQSGLGSTRQSSSEAPTTPKVMREGFLYTSDRGQTKDLPSQNTYQEFASDLQSVASLNSSFRDSGMGTMSGSSLGGVEPVAKQEIFLLLGGNDALNFLFAEAVSRMDKEKFIRNLRRLLTQYSSDLAKEARSGRSKDAANMVHRDSKWFAAKIFDSANPNHASANKDMLSILETNVDKRQTLENYFEGISHGKEIMDSKMGSMPYGTRNPYDLR